MVLIFISIVGVLAALSCSPKSYSGPMESIRIGFQTDQSATEAYVAQDKGFFTQNGLDVIIKPMIPGQRQSMVC